MKQEQVIELVTESGVFCDSFSMGRGDFIEFTPQRLACFISLVEQATLEKAALRLDEIEEQEPEDKWVNGFPSIAIRKLAKEIQ